MTGRRLRASALLALLALVGCEKDVALYTIHEEREANEILLVLHRHDIDAKRVPGKDGVTIMVPENTFTDAVETLRDADLPRARKLSTPELFPTDSMFTTPTQERVRVRYALEQDLARSIVMISGVRDARVHLVLPSATADRRRAIPSAAVMVITNSNFHEPAFAERIRTMVGNSVENLQRENVSVSMFDYDPDAL